jgi:hypothetical protein
MIGPNQQMIRIAFGVTRSKVKITEAWSVRLVSAYYLEDFLSQVSEPIDYGVSRSKVKFSGFLNFSLFSAYYLKNYLSQSLHICSIDW